MQLDRSFAAPFPDCADRLLDPAPLKGKWLGVAIDQAERSGLQKTCLQQITDWRDAEIDARKKGSPGS